MEYILQIHINRLKKAMTAEGLSARELAKKTGISESSISRYLSGQMVPRRDALAKMAESLHVDPVWLAGLDDDQIYLPVELQGLDEDNMHRVLNYAKKLKELQDLGGDES